MKGDRVIKCSRGNLTFVWHLTASTIQMYQWKPEADNPSYHLGFLTTTGSDGEVVEFDQEPFEAHVDWFLDNAAVAEIQDMGDGGDGNSKSETKGSD